jgi:flagellar L-ring protein precursor FlgH
MSNSAPKNARAARAVLAFCMSMVAGNACADTLYSDLRYEGLATDPRARGIGETLTVLIYEQASAATSAGRETKRSLRVAARVRGNDNINRGEIDGDVDSEGRGTITRRGQLIASVSVTVDAITANGELEVSGEQLIEFNEESQFIKISGRVRPEDIAADNTVISSRLAAAQISYTGQGLLGQQQKPGFLSRIFSKVF